MNLKPFVAALLIGGTPVLSLLQAATPPATARPTTFDLVGRWIGTLEFGSMKFKMVLRLVRSEDGKQVRATIDIPDQGARDLPVGAVLYHAPDVRVELDAFRTAFVGKLSADGLSMDGQFSEGPGGRPTPVKFLKDPKGDAAEEKPSFVLSPGEPPDLRGYWRGLVPKESGGASLIGLKIGHFKDGHFEAALDDFERGIADVPSSELTQTNGVTHLGWSMFRAQIDGRLNEGATEFSGTWKQGPKPVAVTFKREKQPVTPFPEGTSFDPDPSTPTDLRGDWKGTLSIGDQKLRLVVTLGRVRGASTGYVATLKSLDQGGRPLLANGVTFTNSVLTVDCSGINGKYTGTLNGTGLLLEGQWEQGGMKTPLNLDRVKSDAKPGGRP